MCLPQTLHALHDGAPSAPRPTRRDVLLGMGAAGATMFAWPGRAVAGRPRRRTTRTQDLTHPFVAGFPVYVGAAPARRTLKSIESDGFYSQQWTFGEHSGTHLDAPGHFVSGGRTADEMRAGELFAPAVVIDIADRAGREPDTSVQVADLRRYERRHGRIPAGALVFMHSGWQRHLADPAAYKNADASGTFHFPGFGPDAVEWLLERRRTVGIGVDTLSLDIGASTTSTVHKRSLGADRYGLENVANLDRVPPRGARVAVGVIPWERGSGGPCRLVLECENLRAGGRGPHEFRRGSADIGPAKPRAAGPRVCSGRRAYHACSVRRPFCHARPPA